MIHINEKQDGVDIPLNDNSYYLPPLIGHAKILYNATNSIGSIYTKEYSPIDGS